jgi:hypothetical protein
MGSYAECWIGNFFVGSSKSGIDPGLMRHFRALDKAVYRGTVKKLPLIRRHWTRYIDDDVIEAVYYRVPLLVVKERLELDGYTLATAKAAFNASIRAAVARMKESAERHPELYTDQLQILSRLTVDMWLKALGTIRRKEIKKKFFEEPVRPSTTLIEYMAGTNWYGYPGADRNVGLRLAIEVCDDNDELIYDLTDLVGAGYVTPDEDHVADTIAAYSRVFSTVGKIVILTEGRSDTRFLASSLGLLYPHLADYYSFMDFDSGRVAGGAGNLLNIVKSFSAAGIVNRVVAVFDNDTAGQSAVESLKSTRLGRNIQAIALPNYEWLRNYPTIGPSGPVSMDINGMAASIELYLGADVLNAKDDNLTPIQWTGYDQKARQYQGEVLCKGQIHDRFSYKLDRCRQKPKAFAAADWDGMRLIWRTIFVAFHKRRSRRNTQMGGIRGRVLTGRIHRSRCQRPARESDMIMARTPPGRYYERKSGPDLVIPPNQQQGSIHADDSLCAMQSVAATR